MAFIPFFNTYYIGVCAQKNKCFNAISAKTVGIITAVFEFVLVAAYIVYHVAYSLVDEYLYFEDIPLLLRTIKNKIPLTGNITLVIANSTYLRFDDFNN